MFLNRCAAKLFLRLRTTGLTCNYGVAKKVANLNFCNILISCVTVKFNTFQELIGPPQQHQQLQQQHQQQQQKQQQQQQQH